MQLPRLSIQLRLGAFVLERDPAFIDMCPAQRENTVS